MTQERQSPECGLLARLTAAGISATEAGRASEKEPESPPPGPCRRGVPSTDRLPASRLDRGSELGDFASHGVDADAHGRLALTHT